MKKLKNLLKNNKIFSKILAFCGVFVIVFSCFLLPTSAAEPRSTLTIQPGLYQFQPMSSDFQPHSINYYIEFPFISNGDSFTYLAFNTDAYGFAKLTYGSPSGSLVVWDSENYFSQLDTGFNDSSAAYCYISVQSRVYATYYGFDPSTWFPSTFKILDDPEELAQYWGAWFNGNNEGYHDGYLEGYNFGLAQNSSSSFGENLIGDTLSAPFKGLNQFVLYEGPNGSVSLGLVLGGVICLSLFIAFLKIFAGG